MTIISILHISDVHFGAPDPDNEQGRITKALCKAVQQHVTNGKRKPDICVFSGDLAYNGSEAQFLRGEEWLKTIVEKSESKLFIIPGNHDVRRPGKNSNIARTLRAASRSKAGYTDYFKEICKARQVKSFVEWHAAARARLPIISDWNESKLACHSNLLIEGMAIHIIGLNTAILSCSDNEAGSLAADIGAFNSYLNKTQTATELVIAVSHHPIGINKRSSKSWLAKWNDKALETLLLQTSGPHLYLYGHLHETVGTSISMTLGQPTSHGRRNAEARSPR